MNRIVCSIHTLQLVFVCWLETQVDNKSVSCVLKSPSYYDILACIRPDPDPTAVIDQAWADLHGPREKLEREGRGIRLCSSGQGVSWRGCGNREPVSGFSESGSALNRLRQ